MPHVANFAYFNKQKKKNDYSMMKGQSIWKPQYDMDHFETGARHSDVKHCKTCLKRQVKKKIKIGFQDQLSLNTGQKYCRMLQYVMVLNNVTKFRQILIKTFQLRKRTSLDVTYGRKNVRTDGRTDRDTT